MHPNTTRTHHSRRFAHVHAGMHPSMQTRTRTPHGGAYPNAPLVAMNDWSSVDDGEAQYEAAVDEAVSW